MADGRWDIAQAYGRFLEFERESSVGAIEVAGVRVWPLVRVSVFSGILLPHLASLGAAHPDMGLPRAHAEDKGRKWAVRVSALLSRLRYGASSAFRSRDILFSLNPRQIRLPDGRVISQILDLFLPTVRHRYAVLESKFKSADYPRHRDWARIFRLDGYDGRLKAFRSAIPGLADGGDAAAGETAAALRDAFRTEIDERRLAGMLRSAAASRLFYFPLLVRLLKRIDAKCVVTVVNYAQLNMILAEAAHSLGVPVAELQHGTIYPAHPAYNLPCPDTLHSPDYLLAWGPHWAAQTRNYALKKTICAGYPLLEYMRAAASAPEETVAKRVVFISQGTVGAELSRRATELARLLPSGEFEIVYKLHPNESRTWKTIYPWLADSGVEVVAGRSVYDLFGGAFATVGVYSTAVVEGTMWGVRSFIFGDMPGADTMNPFLVDGMVESVQSAGELADRLVRAEPRVAAKACGSRFWTPGAAGNIAAALDELAEKGEIA